MKKKPTKAARKKVNRAKDAPSYVVEFWDTNAHSILILESLLRNAKSPGEIHALKRTLRIMRAIDEAQ